MSTPNSKSALLHSQVRQALLSGRYAPGQRIDPDALAAEFHTSQTPVRFALYRLMGEGLLDDHARNGLQVPLPTELALHDLYDLMQRLLTMACDIGFEHHAATSALSSVPEPDGNLVMSIQRLFDGIGLATGHLALYQIVHTTNGRLAPIRHAKLGILEQAADELTNLYRVWRRQNIPALRTALIEYHDQRKRLVPQIIAGLRGQVPFIRTEIP